MVDPIEIKLDEIDSKIDQIVYAPRYKSSYEIDEMMKSKGGGGAGSAATAGLVGGMAAGGVMALVQIIGEAVSNSKILVTVLGTIGKAMGLLIDVILLPFLPILTTGIIWLFHGIMAFHRLWSGIWASKVMQLLVQGLNTLVGIFGKGVVEHLTLGIKFADAVTSSAWQVIEWIWGLSTSNGSAGLALVFLLGPVGMLLNWLWKAVTENQTVNFSLNLVLGAAGDLLNWLWNAVQTGIKISLDFTSNLSDAVGGGVSSAVNAAGGASNDPLGWLGGAASMVAGSGAAGPLAQAASAVASNVFNFNGYDDNKLRKSVENLLRQQNNRYNA